jgi:hypothetical protein
MLNPLTCACCVFANHRVPIGLSLEKMDELFGVTQLLEHHTHVERVAE